jgi:hypothetical protein
VHALRKAGDKPSAKAPAMDVLRNSLLFIVGQFYVKISTGM